MFRDMIFSSCEGDRHPGCSKNVKNHGLGSCFFHLAKVIVIQVSQKGRTKSPFGATLPCGCNLVEEEKSTFLRRVCSKKFH